MIDPHQESVADLSTSILNYTLDEKLIATQPVCPRDSARMMVVFLDSGRIEHRQVRDLPEYLRAGDRLVFNSTRVAPVRFLARRTSDGRETEGLFMHPAGASGWSALVKKAKRFLEGDRLELIRPDGVSTNQVLLGPRTPDGFSIDFQGVEPLLVLERSGWTPLPPYILSHRIDGEGIDATDRLNYQTCFADSASAPSVAAPTAGLHFTRELLDQIEQIPTQSLSVELQVGLGTFKPITAQRLQDHAMHTEWCKVPAKTIESLSRPGGRIIAVGTTSVRVLESLPRPITVPSGCDACFETSLLLSPGCSFRWVDGLLTNFHLPQSTLLALVGAFAGMDRVHDLYALAQREGYRFYSFGDAMLLLGRAPRE